MMMQLLLAALLLLEPDSTRCQANALEGFTLRDQSGRELYIEPSVVSRNAGAVLLLGAPVFATASSARILTKPDSLLGVILYDDGRTRNVALPLVRDVLPVPLAATPSDSGWHIIVGQPDLPSDDLEKHRRRTDSVLKTFVGHDGTIDRRIPLPVPPDLRLVSTRPSALVETNRGLAWSAIARSDAGTHQAILFRESATGWQSRPLTDTPLAAETQLGVTREGELQVFVVRPDVTPGQSDRTSLFYGRPTNPPDQWQRIVIGGADPVSDASIILTDRGLLVSYERSDRLEYLHLHNGRIIASGAVPGVWASSIPVHVPGADAAWIVHRAQVAQRRSAAAVELLAVVEGDIERVLLYHSADIRGVVGAASDSTGLVTVTIPVLNTSTPSLTTHVLHVRLSCKT